MARTLNQRNRGGSAPPVTPRPRGAFSPRRPRVTPAQRARALQLLAGARLVKRARVQHPKHPFSIVVKHYDNRTANRNWVVLDITNNVTGEEKKYRVTTRAYNEWRKGLVKKAGKSSNQALTMVASKLAANPGLFDTLKHVSSVLGADGLHHLFHFL